MENNLRTQPSIDTKRIAFTIPEFERFGNLLHDRLHGLIYYFEEFQGQHMLITNLFDRNPERIQAAQDEGLEDTEALTYAGLDIQRKLLERYGPPPSISPDDHAAILQWRSARNEHWANLRQSALNRENNSETFKFFEFFRNGELDLGDIQVESLQAYFDGADSEFKRNEYPIINDYFDIPNTSYVGIPLMGMGLFQGIVWILFPNEKNDFFAAPDRIKRLVKLFQMEYDHMAISWDTFGVNMNRKSVMEKAIGEVREKNLIQQEIGLKKYYEITEYYHRELIKQNDAVPEKLEEQYLKTATITILLDSYAHNISAHSLTSLSWWFRERSNYGIKENKAFMDGLGRDNNPLITHLKKYPDGNLSPELHRLFKFLLEKGAFWSGITRQTNFAGKIGNLYNVLWFDFMSNPLYLGTIANTEQVRKVFLDVTIYEEELPQDHNPFINTKVVKRTKAGTILSGNFAVVNLDDFSKEASSGSESVFVEKGLQYVALKDALQGIHAFFPGGVIGKHAFFTLLENEIRNVKHFKKEVLKDIQQNGLHVHISIHRRPVDSNQPQPLVQYAMLKIGIWLQHPVEIDTELLVKRIEGLDAKIINERFQPRLGGNYQDKICAAMLMTNNFSGVQQSDTPIGKIYYPWIKTAACKIRPKAPFDQLTEFEVSHRKYQDAKENNQFESYFSTEAGSGYLKKYFHLWQGADVHTMEQNSTLLSEKIENKPRFRFIHLAQDNTTLQHQLRADGILRIVTGLPSNAGLHEAYASWLNTWIKSKEAAFSTTVLFEEGETEVGLIHFDRHCIQFKSYKDINEGYEIPEDTDLIRLSIAHGSKLSLESGFVNYRSHGELMARFCKGVEKMAKATEMDTDESFELLEALATQVCIVDRRVYSRVYAGDTEEQSVQDLKESQTQLERLHLYREQLRLDFRSEQDADWEILKGNGFFKYHFVVLHLSFIEGLKDSTGKKYSEERIMEFIDHEILQGVAVNEVPDNFILVITTGRGRMAWWDAIQSNPEYARFTTFRPIESLLGAVEDALQMPDDINLKFNLVKLLMGS